jgi:hypothetical protein
MLFMTETMTVNVDEKTVARFRRFVRMKYGKRKGALGKAVAEAFNELVAKNESESADERLRRLMHKGYKLGKIIGTRDDWHKR